MTSARANGYWRDTPVLDGMCGSRIHHGGRRLMNFSAINFLGLQEEAEWMTRFCAHANEYGLVTGGSRLTQGVSRVHQTLEHTLSRITQTQRSLTFASGLLANVGFINAMSTRFAFADDSQVDNRDAVFLLDRDSHWSLWNGVAHLASFDKAFSFRHNDPAHLEELLRKLGKAKCVVVFESVYSSDGSVAPVGDLLDVCERYGALSFVDDANGFMVYGPRNRPFFREYQAMSRATFRMVSFSKAVGMEGGAISGPKEFISAFEVLAGTSIFTAAMQPPTAATVVDVLRHLERNPGLMDSYLHKVERFRHRLLELGFQVHDTGTYILSVILGEDRAAEGVRLRLQEMGYSVPVFRYPAVKHNQALMRLMVSNRHSEEDLENFLLALVKTRDEVPF